MAESLGLIHGALDRLWEDAKTHPIRQPDADWRNCYTTAVAEIAANIIRHAYLPATSSRRLRLVLRLFPDRVEGQFDDDGIRFDDGDLEVGGDQADDEPAEGGFGLSIARACLDRLEYSRGEDAINHWLLVKSLA